MKNSGDLRRILFWKQRRDRWWKGLGYQVKIKENNIWFWLGVLM